jgi:hypothetical protein
LGAIQYIVYKIGDLHRITIKWECTDDEGGFVSFDVIHVMFHGQPTNL